MVSLSGCDFFDKKKTPLTGERISVLGDRKDLEPDSDVANMQVVLPPPTVNESWPQSGGFANNAMHNLAVGASPQIVWTADVGSGSSSTRILTTPPVVAEGKVFAKDARGPFRPSMPTPARCCGGSRWRRRRRAMATNSAAGSPITAASCSSRRASPWSIRSTRTPARRTGTPVVSAPVRGAPLVLNDRVYVIAIDNKLQALAASDGSELWQFPGLQETSGYVGGNSAAGSGDTVVAPFTSGEVVALRADNGRPIWNDR